MSEETAAPAATEATPSPAPTPAPAPSPGPSPGGPATPSASEAGDAVGDAMEAQGVTDPGDLDWSRTVTVTVDGKERTVPLSELKGNYELRRSSFQRFEEAKRLRDEADARANEIRDIAEALRDPTMAPSILRELGYEPDQLRQVQEALRAELDLPEEQRKARELERREQQLREREREWNERRAREEAAKAQAVFTKAFDDALEGHGLSGDADARRMMATYLDHRYPQQPGARLTQADIAKMSAEAASYAAEQIEAERQRAIAAIDPSKLVELLPPEAVAALREKRVAEYKDGKTPAPAKATPRKRAAKEKRPMRTLADFRAALEAEG